MRTTTNKRADLPKLVGNIQARAAERHSQLHAPRLAPLTDVAQALRTESGLGIQIPEFDPWDGGITPRFFIYWRRRVRERSLRASFRETIRKPRQSGSYPVGPDCVRPQRGLQLILFLVP
jgi:hypothetical protein